MQIAKHKAVSINYTLTNDAGEVLDATGDGPPLSYIQGIGNLIPGLEAALEGKSPGDKLDVLIAPEDGYGLRDDALVQTVNREVFGPDIELEVGMCFRTSGGGAPEVIAITRIDGDRITVDGNHPLAGESLHFGVEIVDVRDATDEEIDHGHVHGPGGHEH